jgi:transglutaminase-like putative cysteine protease
MVFAGFLLAAPLFADEPKRGALQNPGLEEGEAGKAPPGWLVPEPSKDSGYSLVVSEEKPFAGKRCGVISRAAGASGEVPGIVLQALDATGYRGKRVRLRAAVRVVSGSGNQAMLWFRVDRRAGDGFFDNMADRPIKSAEWKQYEIVGDVADDAETMTFGLILFGGGSAAFDDVLLEVVDKSIAVTGKNRTGAPGLTEVICAQTITADEKATDFSLVFPLPLAYRDQAPLTYRLDVDPPATAGSAEIVAGPGENRLLKLTLRDLGKHRKVTVEYHSLVLVAPTSFARVPKSAKFPAKWPAEVQPWLASSWCVDCDNERVKKLASEIRGESDDVMAVVNNVVDRAKTVFGAAKGRVNNLTAVEALDKQGSCTSCANLVAALLRGAGVPARVLSGYPLWTGPLQTHYIVEAYVPGYGWYPIESTQCRVPWPNHGQVNVSIVPVEHETRAIAGKRRAAAGGVPFQSLTEYEGEVKNVRVVGTLKPYCDHECRLIREMSAADAEWAEALAWAKPRWASWLKSKPKLAEGKLSFGPAADDVKAKSLAELRAALK